MQMKKLLSIVPPSRGGTDPGRIQGAVNSRYRRFPRPFFHYPFNSAMAKNYESEITLFLKEYKARDSGVEQRQREGLARLWDKPQDPELLEGFRAGRVPQRPYVYQAD
jgi:hypothetical protein